MMMNMILKRYQTYEAGANGFQSDQAEVDQAKQAGFGVFGRPSTEYSMKQPLEMYA